MCEDSKIYDNLEQEILEAVARTDFLVFCNNFPYEDREILQAKLIELHNLGKIDTVAEFCHLRNSDSSEIDFFRLRHIFAKILPHISADLEPTALCVSNLIEESGQGMVTQTIVDSLEEFCKQKEQYPEELLMLALTQNTLRRFLTLALVVGMHFDLSKYFNHAIRLIEENSDDEIQRQAIVALRFCSSLEMQMVERIINCLNKQLDISPTDPVSANICLVLGKIYFVGEYKQKSSALLRKIILFAGDLTCYRLTEMLGNFEPIDHDIVDEVFSTLRKVSPEQIGTLQRIDWASDQLIAHGYFRQLVEFLEFLLSNNPKMEIGKTFSTFSHYLLRDAHKLNQVVTRWLVADNFQVRQAVSEILSLRADDILVVSVDRSLLTKEVDTISLVRRAIGFLYIFPRHCTSFLISILEEAEESQKNDIAKYIRDPLLLSFPGLTRKTINSLLPTLSAPTASILERIIDEEEKYASQLINIRNSTQLGPSESQKETCKRKNAQWHKDFSEKARDAS